MNPSMQLGEDIRISKLIFEQRFGEQEYNKPQPKLWMDFAKEVMEYQGTKTLEETADKLEIKYRKLI